MHDHYLPARPHGSTVNSSGARPTKPPETRLNVWRASTEEVRAMLAEGPMHTTNITEHLNRCRAVFFYREDQLAPANEPMHRSSAGKKEDGPWLAICHSRKRLAAVPLMLRN